MRKIQIEDDEKEYLMDPSGQIYDMQGNYIGVAAVEDDQIVEEEGL
jgi:hypothetical protein